MTNLTDDEITVMKMCLTYDTRSDQLRYNSSDADWPTISIKMSMNATKTRQLLESLIKKRMGNYADNSDELGYDVFMLSELGIHTIFDILED